MQLLDSFKDLEAADDTGRLAVLAALPKSVVMPALAVWPDICPAYTEPAALETEDMGEAWAHLWSTTPYDATDRESFEDIAAQIGQPLQDTWITMRTLISCRLIYPDGTLSVDALRIVQNAANMLELSL